MATEFCGACAGPLLPLRGASLRQAAELLHIEMFDLAEAILKYGSCAVGEFSAVPSEDSPAQPDAVSSALTSTT
jgi:hypothetical protein